MKNACRTDLQRWYASVAGRKTAEAVQTAVAEMSNAVFGYYAVQVGELAGEYTLLHDSRIRCCFSISLDGQAGAELIADPVALPLVLDNLDLVVASHVLDCAASPHEVLREIERVLVPEGHCILIAFNPISLRGISLLCKSLFKRGDSHNLYTAFRVRDWFEVLGFEVLEVRSVGQCCRFDHWRVLQRLTWLKQLMALYSRTFGYVRLIHVRKKVIKMTPWKPKVTASRLLKPGMAVNTGGAGKAASTTNMNNMTNDSSILQKDRDEKS